MKKLILISALLFTIVGCGPSQKEKENIAEMACAEIMATRNFEEARRIRILNEARLEVGLDPFPSSSLFEINIRLGGKSSCIDYIIPPPPPPPKTQAQIAAEKAAAEARAEAEERDKKWNAMTEEEQCEYIKKNPDSGYIPCMED